MLDLAVFFLFNEKPWEFPIDVGEFSTIPSKALTETQQKSTPSE